MRQLFICTGLSFADLATVIGKDEVWVAAAFYGQVRSPCTLSMSTLNSLGHPVRPNSTQNKSRCLASLLDIPASELHDDGLGIH